MYPATHRREEPHPVEQFFRTLLAALNPRSYHSLSQQPLLGSFRYLLWVLLFCLVVMVLLAIPNLFNIAPYVQTELSRFSTLTVDVTQTMTGPFVFTQTTPLLTIDTTNSTQPKDAHVLVTQDTLYYRLLPFTTPTAVPLGEGDLLTNSGNIANLMWYLMLLLLPGLLILLFLLTLVKYLILILIAAFVGFILTGVIRFQIRFSQLLNVAIYATTIAIVIELFTKPFLVSSFYLHYVFFAIYFILGMIGSGDFEPTHPKRMKQQ